MRNWKIAQIIGVLVLLVGVVVRVGGEINGTLIALIGLLVFVAGRIGAWLKSDKP